MRILTSLLSFRYQPLSLCKSVPRAVLSNCVSMTDPQGGVPSYVYDTLNLGSPTKIWPIPGVLKSSSRASHSSSFESACYANVDADLVWVQMGATSVFSAGSSKPMPTITSPLTPTTLKIICSASKMRMTTRHRSATTHTAELCKPLFPDSLWAVRLRRGQQPDQQDGPQWADDWVRLRRFVPADPEELSEFNQRGICL